MARIKLNLIPKVLTRQVAITLLILSVLSLHPVSVLAASGVVDSNNKYAWGENLGWVNFGATGGNIAITDDKITGFAWSQAYGWINFGPFSNYSGVTNNASSVLGGHAWSSSLGWIAMNGVTIDTNTGVFGGIAGTPANPAGRINFGCSTCKVSTNWRPGSAAITTATPATTPPATTPPATAAPTAAEPAAPDDGGIPGQLFDIRLLLDRSRVPSITDLIARVTFESFGREATPVSMTFTILDGNGAEVWKSQDSTTVQTEAVFVKRFFAAPSLPDGNYKLRLKTLYNDNVQDTFDAPFTIAPSAAGAGWLWWLLLLLLPLIFILYIIKRRSRRREEQKRRQPWRS